jgi:serine/threonine protein kinase
MAELRPGSRCGPWTIARALGNGGNATVWVAARNGTEGELALKVLNVFNEGREPYKRFVREISFLKTLEDKTGILPLVDAYLPEHPSSQDRPWLAMPIATGIADALAGAPLESVVEAMSQIATTMARLADLGVSHRDLKPPNLYRLEDAWLVGDFGLVKIPDIDELTRSGRPLGPAHFTPYEMIQNPRDADPRPADVYSLGKTLWVLGTEQRFPPQGHQRADARGFTISDFRPHSHAAALDGLVDRMTRLQPSERPTMAQVARDLQAWGNLAAQPVALDVSTFRARVREKLSAELTADELLQQRKDLAHAAVRRFQELVAPLNESLQEVHPAAEIDSMNDDLTRNILRSREGFGKAPPVFNWQRCSQIGSGPAHHRYTLRMGRSIELADDGTLTARALIAVGYPNLGGDNHLWQSQSHTAPVGTVEAEKMLLDAVAELTDQLSVGLEIFVTHL